MPRWIETDTLSNQNISSALAIGAYTADRELAALAAGMCTFRRQAVDGPRAKKGLGDENV